MAAPAPTFADIGTQMPESKLYPPGKIDWQLEFFRNILQTHYSKSQLREHLVKNGAFKQAVEKLNRDQMIALILNPEDRGNKRYFYWGRGGYFGGSGFPGMTGMFEPMSMGGFPMFPGSTGTGELFGEDLDGGDGTGICAGLNTYMINNDPEVIKAKYLAMDKQLKSQLVLSVLRGRAHDIAINSLHAYAQYRIAVQHPNANRAVEDYTLDDIREAAAAGYLEMDVLEQIESLFDTNKPFVRPQHNPLPNDPKLRALSAQMPRMWPPSV
jgi:hypothetical protein